MHEIRIPRLGWSMEEGIFQGWLLESGAEVEAGEPLFELEGEKALQEIEALEDGTLYFPPDAPGVGSTVLVGDLLGWLLEPGESPPSALPAPNTPAAVPDAVTVPKEQSQPTARTQSPVSTPRARRLAGEIGIDWTTVTGTGRGGRIREADIRAASSSTLSSRRAVIAERLQFSRDRTVPVTLTATANARGLFQLREQFRSLGSEPLPAYTDIVAALVARVLPQHPQLAVQRDAGSSVCSPVSAEEIHIGIAVDTSTGLLVPVLRNVQQKPLSQLVEESRVLVDRARAGRLTANEMLGGVITLSNLGSYGVAGFTPVINWPEVAILGLGAIEVVPVVTADERIVPGRQMVLSLTFDHAVMDGAPAAAFLQSVVTALENTAASLLT